MVTTSLTLLAASLSVVYSFEPADDGSGRYDYVVEVEPQLLDSLARGGDMPIESQVPKHVSAIRTVRVVLGGGSSSGPIKRTSYKQLQGNWTASSTSGSAPTYSNSAAGNTNGSHVPPPRLLGAVQDAGTSIVSGTRSGLQEVGQRLQSAGQHMTSAVDDLSGGTFSRAGEVLSQPFANGTPANGTSSSAGPLQTVGAVARDFVNDTQQQFQQAGQAVRDTADRMVGTQNTRPTDYRTQPTDYRTQPSDYRSQAAAPSTMPATSNEGRYLNQNATDSTGLADPGRNPFQAGDAGSTVRGPSFGQDYRNPAGGNQASAPIDARSQSPFEARPNDGSIDGRYAGNNSQGDMVPVSSIDSWQYQQQGQAPRNDNSFAAGQATISSDRGDPWARDPWGNQSAAHQPPGAATGQPGVHAPSGQYAGPQPGNVAFQQAGLSSPSDGDNKAAEAKPWAPLLGTGVALIGSLGANLFLGFSFLDARHKYLSAIRRGARSFSRGEVA